MTPSLDRTEAEMVLEVVGGLVEVANTDDQVVNREVHMTSLAYSHLS